MFSITKENQANVLFVHLKGVLDGSINFNEAIGTPSSTLIIRCTQITHVNSSAIHPWRRYFRWVREQGVALRFQECPPAIVDYFNSVNDILCGGRVESVLAYFYCKKCKSESLKCLSTLDAKELRKSLGLQTCASCGGPESFDEIPREYFAFLGDKIAEELG